MSQNKRRVLNRILKAVTKSVGVKPNFKGAGGLNRVIKVRGGVKLNVKREGS